MLASIAIVGRPNVGKSSLFNRLTRTRQALVADSPGLTRDRQYGIIQLADRQIIVIDTGGIGEELTPIDRLSRQQTESALSEVEMVLFMVDGRAGPTISDEEVLQRIRRLNKPVILVINKVEGLDVDLVVADFLRWGLDTYVAIAAEHNLGITQLGELILQQLPQSELESQPLVEEQVLPAVGTLIKVAFVGVPNVGKSTLINRILGEERVIAHDQPGTTRDSITIDFTRRGQRYQLIDTAGVRRRRKVHEKLEKFSVIKTLQSVAAAEVVVLVLDATQGVVDQDLKLLGWAWGEGKAVVVAVNKWDHLSAQQRIIITEDLKRRFNFVSGVKLQPLSALYGTGVGGLFDAIGLAYASATRELGTGELNRILRMAVQHYPPPRTRGYEIKLRYVHAGHNLPPTIIVHGARVEAIPANYRRYLEAFFRKQLRLVGTPLVILFKNQQQSRHEG